jgi:hypothetical protein
MRFAPLAHLRSTQSTSHLREYSAADELDAAVARGEQGSYRMRTEMRAQAGDAGHQVLEAIQVLVNVHGAGQLRRIQPHATVLARNAARHAALNSIIGYKVYGKALLGIDEVITPMV